MKKLVLIYVLVGFWAVAGCSKPSNNQSNGSKPNKPQTAPNAPPRSDDSCQVEPIGKTEKIIVDDVTYHFLISKTQDNLYGIIITDIENLSVPFRVTQYSAGMGFIKGGKIEECQTHYDILKSNTIDSYLKRASQEILAYEGGRAQVSVIEIVKKAIDPFSSPQVKAMLLARGWNYRDVYISYPNNAEPLLEEKNFWYYAGKVPGNLIGANFFTLADYCGVILGEAKVKMKIPQGYQCGFKEIQVNIYKPQN